MKTKGIFASVLVLALSIVSSAAFAVGGRAATRPVTEIPGFRTIETLAAQTPLKGDITVAKALSDAVNSGRITEVALESAFKGISESFNSGKLPQGLSKPELNTLLANRVYALILSASCTNECDSSVAGNINAKQIMDVLSSGEKLSNLSGWGGSNLKGLIRLQSLLSSRIQVMASKTSSLNKDGTISGAVLAEAIRESVQQYLKDTRSKLTVEQFVTALIANCA